MGMTPAEFFDAFVEGNAQDCHEDPGCVRRAFNAAVATSHLADHLYEYDKRHSKTMIARFPNFRDYLNHLGAKTKGGFTDVRSIAIAYKHLYTLRGNACASVSSAGAIVSIELNGPKDSVRRIAEEYEISAPSKGRLFVAFTRKDGTTTAFLPVLDAVVHYWREHICEVQ